MTPQKFVAFATAAFRKGRQFLVVGAPGVGKTDMVAQAAQAAGCDIIITHPAISDPTDYKGLPARSNDNTHAVFLPFGELWRAMNATRPTVFFIDDLGQSPEAVQKALMQLLWGRRLNGHKLPDCITFVGATNDVGQRAGVSGIIEPVKSRWHTIVTLETSVDDWTLWAVARGLAPELIAFIRTRPELLHKFEPTREIKNSPCPRTWALVGDWLADGVTEFEVLSGAVGKGAATEFLAFLEMAREAPSIDSILLNPALEPVPSKPELKYVVASALAHRASKSNMEQIMTYLYRMPQPFRVLCLKDAAMKDKTITQTNAFVAWAAKEGHLL